MSAFSLYDPSTGLFIGHTFSMSIDPERSQKLFADSLKAQTPAGCAVAEGRHDHLCKRIDIERLSQDREAALALHQSSVESARSTFVPAVAGQPSLEFREQPFIFHAGPQHVIDYQPPQPSPDHEWNATTRRWTLSAAASDRQAKRQGALARIAALRDSAHDHVRALVLDSANAEARKALQAIEAEIVGLRTTPQL